jgi:hypothetical protein
MDISNTNLLTSIDYSAQGTLYNIVELPISLNRSYFCSNLIKDQIVIRVYFKGNVVYDGI